MNNCDSYTKQLADYISNKQKDSSTEIPAALKEHVEKCESCKNLIENPKKAKLFLKAYSSMVKLAEATQIPSKPDKPQKGQIWQLCQKISVPSEKEGRFKEIEKIEYAIILEDDLNNGKFAAIPLYLNYRMSEISKDDMLLKPEDTSLYLPLLAECWNSILVEPSSLSKYFGSISEAYFSSLVNRYNFFKIEGKKALDAKYSNETTAFFRKYEINRFTEYLGFEAYSAGEEKATETSDSRSYFAKLKDKILGNGPRFLFGGFAAGIRPLPFGGAFSASEKKSDDELMFFFEKRVKPAIQALNGAIVAELLGNSILFCRNDGVEKEFSVLIGDKEFHSKDYVLELKLEDFDSKSEEKFEIII